VAHDIRRYSDVARKANIARMKKNLDGPDENPVHRADPAVVSDKLMFVWGCDAIPTCITVFPYYQTYAAASVDNGPSPAAVTAATR
jgi:hypothetical protein